MNHEYLVYDCQEVPANKYTKKCPYIDEKYRVKNPN